MGFYPHNATVPIELRADGFLLRMLRATDVDLDYDAVIDSRPILLLRSSGRWPREGFTLAENLADLEMHERDHHARTSFTYTVMNPDESLCLGCVYINPLRETLRRLGAPAELSVDIGDHEAEVTFWVRPSYVARERDRRLLELLRSWFAEEWAFTRATFRVNKNQRRERTILEDAGLQLVHSIELREEPHAYYFYA